MKLIKAIPQKPLFKTPCAITIGNFDGLHTGHQFVLKRLSEISHQNQIPSVVISFKNHPAEILRPERPICKICTNEQKIKIFEKKGIDTLILLPFTKELSELSVEEFISNLQKNIPFSHLILGWDATLGKNRHGNKEIVKDIAKKQNFQVEYLEQYKIDQTSVSSSAIRACIQEGNLQEAERLLGRPFSIYSAVLKGEGRGKKIGFPTANMDVKGLCLPPLGVYAVKAIINDIPFKGIANLGLAPTVRKDTHPTLEVHIFDFNQNLYNQTIEVIFSTFLRPEKKFNSLDELKAQIARDIQIARN